jgi:hypothetical protein
MDIIFHWTTPAKQSHTMLSLTAAQGHLSFPIFHLYDLVYHEICPSSSEDETDIIH